MSVPLVIEYESVLLRHLHLSLRPKDVELFLDYLCSVAHHQEIFFLWRPLLRDPNDDLVAELAFASQAEAIVTHNIRDFGAATQLGLTVLTPGELLSRGLWR